MTSGLCAMMNSDPNASVRPVQPDRMSVALARGDREIWMVGGRDAAEWLLRLHPAERMRILRRASTRRRTGDRERTGRAVRRGFHRDPRCAARERISG